MANVLCITTDIYIYTSIYNYMYVVGKICTSYFLLFFCVCFESYAFFNPQCTRLWISKCPK